MVRPTPLIVLVHGAWHGAWCWSSLQAALDARGLPSVAVDLPGHGTSVAQLTDLPGDAAHLADVVARLDRPVVLVGHSYGGAVISLAAADPRVRPVTHHLVYVTAFALRAGEAVLDIITSAHGQRVALADAILPADDGTSTIDPDRAVAAFYADCPRPAAEAALARLDRQSMVSFGQPLAESALGEVPSTFVRCTRDEAIHIAHQDVMAERCDSVVTIDTDHSPFVGRAADLADALALIVGANS